MTRLVLVLGDQLTDRLSAMRKADKSTDVIVMAEVMEEATYVRHHAKKIAFIFSAMRHFAKAMRAEGWQVDYTRLDDAQPHETIASALLAAAEAHGADEVIATRPGEWRLIEMLENLPLDVTVLEDDRFVATEREFADWARGRKELRMEWFYREMRRKTGLLMEGDAPVGGKWNYDHDNRKAPPKDIEAWGPMIFPPDEMTEEVLDLVDARFPDTFGQLRPFGFAVDSVQARQALRHFIEHSLPRFGDYQDAMLKGERFLYHSILSLYINTGLLDPLEVARAVEEAYRAGQAPLNAVEGFIRQIIGWRDYMRHLWYFQGPDHERKNGLGHRRKLPDFFWTGETDMACIRETVVQTIETAYAHHIQRLMVTGNFLLLAGIDPAEVYDWYMCAYIDAFGWAMAGNVIGMSQFADGGIVASKPYVSSANYIDKMSDYCGGCAYSAKTKTGEGACPFNLLYWAFLDRHRDRFKGNPRMAQMYATWGRMDDTKRETILAEADAFLDRMARGERV